MKNKLVFTVVFAVLFVFAGGIQNSYAQDGPIAGGYGDADVKDKEVIAAAKFAVRKRGQNQKATITLLAVNKAQVQVVAGLNYKVCLQVKVKRAGKKAVTQNIEAVVYKNLKRVYSLTSWIVINGQGCGT